MYMRMSQTVLSFVLRCAQDGPASLPLSGPVLRLQWRAVLSTLPEISRYGWLLDIHVHVGCMCMLHALQVLTFNSLGPIKKSFIKEAETKY